MPIMSLPEKDFLLAAFSVFCFLFFLAYAGKTIVIPPTPPSIPSQEIVILRQDLKIDDFESFPYCHAVLLLHSCGANR